MLYREFSRALYPAKIRFEYIVEAAESPFRRPSLETFFWVWPNRSGITIFDEKPRFRWQRRRRHSGFRFPLNASFDTHTPTPTTTTTRSAGREKTALIVFIENTYNSRRLKVYLLKQQFYSSYVYIYVCMYKRNILLCFYVRYCKENKNVTLQVDIATHTEILRLFLLLCQHTTIYYIYAYYS